MALETGLTLMLFDAAGNAQTATDWGEAAERIVRLLNPDSTGNDAYEYARAHRILDAIWGDKEPVEPVCVLMRGHSGPCAHSFAFNETETQ